MPPKPVPTPPLINRIIVGTLAVIAGIWVIKDAGKDFQFIKFEPHSEEEIERRKRDNVPMTMTHTDQRTLDYTPEAKERLKKLIEEKNHENQEKGQLEKDDN